MGLGGCRKLIQVICDDLWRWIGSHQAMGGCGRCESPPNNKNCEMMNPRWSTVSHAWVGLVFRPSARQPVSPFGPSGPVCPRARVGKVGTAAPLRLLEMGVLGWAGRPAGGGVKSPRREQARSHQSTQSTRQGTSHNASPHPPRAVTYQSVKSMSCLPCWTHPPSDLTC